MRISVLLLMCFVSSAAMAISSIDKAVFDAGINRNDSLEVKIDKTLYLLNEKRYFQPKVAKLLPPPFDLPYHLDSMRTPEEILEQKVGGSCGSSALAFAAVLNASGVKSDDIQIVASVTNTDLKIICPVAGKPRVQNPQSGASGHVFVALRFPDGKWKIINSIDGSRTYERAEWFSPTEVQRKIKSESLQIPKAAFKNLPEKTFGSGLTVFQSWSLRQVPIHTFEQRYDLIASGDLKSVNQICRFSVFH